tara:strand:- start:86 stop:424 length:339 start_codon:yes stop_codon:yes gene_type:complete
MSGARGRPHKIPKSRTYNLTFSIDQVKKVRERAKKLGVSAPTLIREAVKVYLEDGINIIQSTGNGFSDGIEAALSALKKEFAHTKYASGKTLGEVAAEKVRERLEGEKKSDT